MSGGAIVDSGPLVAHLFDRHAVLTLDSDFSIYRKHGDKPIPLIAP